MHILDAARTAAALPWSPLVNAVTDAGRQLATGLIDAPERLVVPIDAASVLLCMPALGDDIGITKLITVHADNARHGLPAIQGEVIVFDKPTGRRLAMLDGPTVTPRRTAAVTLLGIRMLVSKPPESALLIGSGTQAAAHAEALAECLGMRDFTVATRNIEHARTFCDHIAARFPGARVAPVEAGTLETECPEVDLMIALTTARSPVIPSRLPPHTLAIGVGAFKPDMREFPDALLHARPIVVDHLAGARHEAGDLIHANIDWDTVRELPQLVAHGYDHGAVLPVLKTVGHAAWDLAAARVALTNLYKHL